MTFLIKQYPTFGTEQSYLAKLEQPKKKKPSQWSRNDALLEPDLAAFDHLQGLGLRQRINYNDDGVQEESG